MNSIHSLHAVRRASASVRTVRKGTVLLLPFTLLLFTLLSSATPAFSQKSAKTTLRKKIKKRVVIPIEQRPYLVRLSVAFSREANISPHFRRRLLLGLAAAVDRSYGLMWSMEIRENRWISTAGQLGLRRLTAGKMAKRFIDERMADGKPLEKLFLLSVEKFGTRFEISGREYDNRSQQLGPIEFVETRQKREVVRELFSLLPRLFHPVLKIDKVQQPKTERVFRVQLRLQAGVIPPNDPAVSQLRTGSVLVPYFRYLHRKTKKVSSIQFHPWTYIAIDKIDHEFVTGSLVSVFGNPLGTGRVRNVELLAHLIRRRTNSSRLKMVYQTDETKTLVGYHINLVGKRFYRDKPDKPPIKRFSGRDGVVNIPVDPDNPIVWVYVYSGSALLARVPYVPGVSDNETVSLPDDSIRLKAEGEISLLRGSLIDTVARRVTMLAVAYRNIADAEKIAKNGKIDEAKRRADVEKLKRKNIKIFIKLDEMDSIAEFESRLTAIRLNNSQSAELVGNKFAKRRIAGMCDRLGKYLKGEDMQKFLGKQIIRDRRTDVEQKMRDIEFE